MKPGKNFIERALSDSINCAVNQAVKNPSGPDPFGSALKSSMDWYALTLPAALQHDRVTNKETIPSKRQVTVNSYNNQNAKPKHRLIKEVKGGKIVFSQPLAYTVKTGDTLSEIAWKHTGRRASVQNLKNWNTIFDDIIRPGQVLKLADPEDKLIKEAIAKLSKSELSSRNPSINLDTLSREMVIQHGGLLDSEYQVLIKLEYNEPWQNFLNPELFEQPEQGVPWAPGYSGGNGAGNSFDQPHYPDEVRLGGGEWFDNTVDWTGDHAHELAVTVAAGLNAYAGYEEVKAGIGMLAAPTGVTQIAGAYAIGDGIVRMVSAPIQIYGTWTGNMSLENSPHNLLSTIGFFIDSGTAAQWTTGGTAQIWMGIGGDFGLSRMKLIQMVTKGFNNPNTLMRMKDIGNAGWQIVRPYKDAIQKGLK